MVLGEVLLDEVKGVVGCDRYERSKERRACPKDQEISWTPSVWKRYKRRQKTLNRVILEGFLLGHSTRRTTRIFKRVFKSLISAQTVFNLVNPSNRFAILPGRAGKDAGEINEADTLTELQAGLKVFCLKWRAKEPKAVKNFLSGFELTLTYSAFCGEPWRTLIKTTNPLEHYLEELQRRIKSIRRFANQKSAERILYGLIFYVLNACPAREHQQDRPKQKKFTQNP